MTLIVGILSIRDLLFTPIEYNVEQVCNIGYQASLGLILRKISRYLEIRDAEDKHLI